MFPQIKANYIDTGKVRLVYREVYFNRPSLWAGMIARCAPAERYFGIVEVLFDRQPTWAGADDEQEMVGQLFSIGRQAGLSDEQMDACLKDRALAEGAGRRVSGQGDRRQGRGYPDLLHQWRDAVERDL